MVGTIDRAQTRPPAVRTPGRLLMLIAGPALCVLGFAVTVTASMAGVRDGYQGVGDSARTAVAAAGRLSYNLADMDGKAAEILLVGDDAGLPQSHDALYQAFANDRADANARLAAVGSGLDAVPGAAAAFVAVENGLDRYSSDVTEAFYLDGLDHGQAPGRPPAAALTDYQSGTAAMHQSGTGVLAEADALLGDEESAAGNGYDGRLVAIGRVRAADIGLTVLVLVVLIVVQVRLARKFHRVVNPLIALSTVFTLIFGVLLFSALEQARDSYVTQRAGETGALWQDEAYVADMKASDSRLLLDVSSPAPGSAGSLAAQQRQFADDRSRIVTSAPAFAAYLADDQYLRAIVAKGTNDTESSDGVAFDIGQTDQGFAKYVSDVNKSIEVDSALAAAAGARGANSLLPWLWLPSAWAVLMLLSILGGVAPRLCEYLLD